MAVLPSNWSALKALPNQVREMILGATESERIDVLGEVREVEKALASERKLAMSEIEKDSEGTEWYVDQGRVCKRSYNDSALLVAIADAKGLGPLAAIGYLLQEGIITLNWKWKPKKGLGLKRLIEDLGITVKTVQREIISGDDADIGENWVDGYASTKLIRDRKSK